MNLSGHPGATLRGGIATAALGSLVLALALLSGELGPEDAFAASVVDELYQAERWGEEEEAARARDRLRADIAAYHQFMTLCGAMDTR